MSIYIHTNFDAMTIWQVLLCYAGLLIKTMLHDMQWILSLVRQSCLVHRLTSQYSSIRSVFIRYILEEIYTVIDTVKNLWGMIGKNHSVKKFSIFKLQFQFHNHLIKLLKTEIERTGGLRRINDVKWYFREISPAGLSNVFFTAVNIKSLFIIYVTLPALQRL